MPLIKCHNVNSRKHFSVDAELEGVCTVQEILNVIFSKHQMNHIRKDNDEYLKFFLACNLFTTGQ